MATQDGYVQNLNRVREQLTVESAAVAVSHKEAKTGGRSLAAFEKEVADAEKLARQASQALSRLVVRAYGLRAHVVDTLAPAQGVVAEAHNTATSMYATTVDNPGVPPVVDITRRLAMLTEAQEGQTGRVHRVVDGHSNIVSHVAGLFERMHGIAEGLGQIKPAHITPQQEVLGEMLTGYSDQRVGIAGAQEALEAYISRVQQGN